MRTLHCAVREFATQEGCTADRDLFKLLPRHPGEELFTPQLHMPPPKSLMLGVGLAAGFKQYRDRHADNQYRRRQKVRKLAGAGDAQANAIMNAEAARGQKRRDAAGELSYLSSDRFRRASTWT